MVPTRCLQQAPLYFLGAPFVILRDQRIGRIIKFITEDGSQSVRLLLPHVIRATRDAPPT